MQQQEMLKQLCTLGTPQARYRPHRTHCIRSHLSLAKSDTQRFKGAKCSAVRRFKHLNEP